MKIITDACLHCATNIDNYFAKPLKQSLFILLYIALLICVSPRAWSNAITIDQPKLLAPMNNDPAYPSLSPTFQWTMGTGAAPTNLLYDIYLGTDASQMQLIAENFGDGSFNDSSAMYIGQDTFNLMYFYILKKSTTYYWKVVAKENSGASKASEIRAFTTSSPNLFAPDAPVYLSPGNNATNIPVSSLLTWQPALDADGDIPVYDVYLSTTASTTTLVAANVSGTSFKINSVLNGNTAYYWKVVARDPGGKEATGTTWKFTTQNNAPAAATMPYPADQSVNIPYSVTLNWQKANDPDGDAVSYELWYGTGALPDRIQATANNNLSLVLASNTTYSWKLVSIDSHGDRTESPVWKFTTGANSGNTAPIRPVLAAPANNSTGVLFQPPLQWSAATDNEHDNVYYTLYLGTDGLNFTPVASRLTVTGYTPLLQPGMNYYWKVAATDEKGGITESDTWQFTTTAQDIGITNLRVYYRYNDPADLYIFESVPLGPAFSIATPVYTTRGKTTIKDAIAIVLDYTDPNTVVSLELPSSLTATSNIIYNKGLPAGASKYFQLEGKFGTHNTIKVHLTNGVVTRTFTIDAQINQKPTVPVPTAPANEAADVSIQPEFSWTGGEDADGQLLLYRLYLGTSTDNLNSIGFVPNKKNFTATIPLAGAQKYFWKVVVTDAENETAESEIHTFVTKAVAPLAPQLLYPREISTYVETNVTLAWKYLNEPGISYDIYFDKNSSPQRIASGISATSYTLQNLTPATAYYWKVVAFNQQGVHTASLTGKFITKPVDGNETGTFTDIRDGQIYQWVLLNGMKWMTHNLAYKPQQADGYQNYEYFRLSTDEPGYVTLNNNNQNLGKYGYLYNWKGAMNFDDPTDTTITQKQGVCPCGWRVPTEADWQKLTPLNNNIPALMHHSTWNIPGKENDWLNASGFSLLPGGFYNMQTSPPGFQTNAYQFWLAKSNRNTSTQTGNTWLTAQNRFFGNSNSAFGYASVRCVKNSNDNQAPGKPALVSPLNNSTHTLYSLLLQWTQAMDADGNAVRYDLYVDTLPTPVKCVQTGISGNNFRVTELLSNKTWYWKVRAYDEHGEATDSETWSFTTNSNNNTPPAAAQLQLPANGSTGVNAATVQLTWQAGTDADGDAITYNLYTGKQQAALQLTATGITGSTYTMNNVSSSTTYYWKVVALDARGGVTASDINNFTTINRPPTAPVLLTPSNGMQGIKELRLTWAPSTDPDGDTVYYQLLSGTNPAALSSRAYSEETFSIFGGQATPQNTTFYWKIIATDLKGGETASELRQFTTYRNVFADKGITPVTPALNSNSVSLNPSFSWSKPVNNALYDLYVGNTSYLVLAGENLTDTPFVLQHYGAASSLTPHANYTWKVVIKDALGNTYDSDAWPFKTRNSVPAKPTLTLPVNGATNQPYTVTLGWPPSSDADGDLVLYDIYLGTNANPTTLLTGDQQETSFTTSLLNPNTTYYWKVVAKDVFGGSITSDVFTFTIQNNAQNTAPQAPRLKSPVSHEGNVTSAVTLQWDVAFDIDGDALVYDVYMGTSMATITPVATGLNALQYIPAAVTNGVTYYWRVVARDGRGGETASSVWTFTAKNNAPTAPDLLMPLMNEVLAGSSTMLTWNPATDPDNDAIVYDVYLDKNPQPVTQVAKGLISLTCTSPVIDNNGIYYWRVVARDVLGAETSSAIFTFMGKNEKPSAPVLQSPAHSQTIDATTPVLTWAASTDIDSDPPGYDVYLGTSTAALQKIATVFTPTFITGTLTTNTIYYWKVVARDKQGSTAESALWSFHVLPATANQPPGKPQLISPADQSTGINGQQASLSWTAVTEPENDPVTYDLYVATDDQAAARIAANLSTTGFMLKNLAPNTTWYWKVVAKDDHGNSDTSSIWRFATAPVQPVTYTISGKISNSQGEGMTGVTLQGFPGTVTTNAAGIYSATVSPGFSGTITPILSGYTFEPEKRTLNNVQADAPAQHFTGTMVTATNDPELDKAITISPNPARGLIVITLPELLHSWEVEVYNANGYKIYHRQVNGYTRKLELLLPDKGIHFIRMTNNKRTVVRKVVVI